MRSVPILAVLAACGRLHFEGSPDGQTEILAITSPAENAEVGSTATLVGTCASGRPVTVGGSGLVSTTTIPCDAGAFAGEVAFTDGDGFKLVTATQEGATVARTFRRVTPAMVRAASVATQPSAGDMIDCDLVFARPADLEAGDLLFGMIYSDGGSTGSIATGGFTRAALAGPTHVAFWKLATAAEPAAYTFRVVAGIGPFDTCEAAGVLAAFSAVDPEAPILDESGRVTGSDPNVVAPSVTAPKPAILVGAWGSNGPEGGFTQAGMTPIASASTPFANALLVYERIEPGPTGPRTATLSAASPAAAGLFVINGQP